MISWKTWFGLFVVFAAVSLLCLVTEGNYLGDGELGHLSAIASSSSSWEAIKNIFQSVVACLFWAFPFFESGIGLWVKIPLMCLSAAIAIPLVFEVFRLLFKPFGG